MIISKKIELNLLVTAILLFTLRMAVPFMIYIFSPYFILFSIFFIVKYWNIGKKTTHLIAIGKIFFPFLIVSGILIISFIFSKVQPPLILKDILHIVVSISLIIVLFLEINDRINFKQFEHYFSIQMIAFSAIISIMGLIKFYLCLRGIVQHFLGEITPYNTSLTSDYNFYCLASIIGFIFACRVLLKENISNKLRVLIQVILFIISLNILFSSSRRGFAIFLILILFIFLFSIYSKYKPKLQYINIRIYLLLFILFTALLSVNRYHKQTVFKILKLNKSYVNIACYTNVVRYSSIFNIKCNQDDINKLIYGKPDSRYPYTWLRNRIYSEVYPLTGNNIEIVPQDVIGYKMDSTCNATTWGNNAYSYTNISCLFQGDTIKSNSEYYYASVYCYVSADFDGTWVRISAEGYSKGNITKGYDLTKKGVWQKIQILFTCKNSIPPVFLYWSKNNVTDFRNLKGYVIFAYPEYKKGRIDPKDPDSGWGSRIYGKVFSVKGKNCKIVPENSVGYKMDSTCNASSWRNNAYSYTNISCLFQGDTIKTNSEYYYASVYCYVSEDFNGTWARISSEGNSQGNTIKEYDLSRKGEWQKLHIEFTSTNDIPPVYLYWSKYGVIDFKTLKGYVVFAYPEYKKITKTEARFEFNKTNIEFNKSVNHAVLINTTSISNIFESIITFFNSSRTVSDTVSSTTDIYRINKENNLFNERTERWRYSWYLFKSKYTWLQKFFGNGFDYFEKFGSKFDGAKYDWPHNPFISAFLYSGILGGLAFIWFMVMVFINYILYLKRHLVFFISFMVTFFFVFFSDYSLFNTPMFTILCIIPFFTKYLCLKEEYGDIKKIPFKRLFL